MQPDRWEPDELLVPALLARSRPYGDLSFPDRCWAVAGLTLHGLTAEDIAERLVCSLRLVRSLRAEPLTTVCLWAQREAGAFADELRLSRSEHRHALAERDCHALEVTRLRGQLLRLSSSRTPDRCSRGHDLSDRYNCYTAPSGRTFCRACHRERQASYRARQRAS